jgi:hypothetical protein
MRINSEEARTKLETNSYVVIKNYATPPDALLFNKAYAFQENVKNLEDGKPLGPMKTIPEYFFENESVNNFYNECLSIYGEKTTMLLIEGKAWGSPTTRHSDEADVIHWQCSGSSEWTFYDHPEKGFETKIILSSGDVIWFKKHQDHSVQNLEDKVSIIFMENNILRDFIAKQYAAVGKEFK